MNRQFRNTALLICDLQTKTVRNLYYKHTVLANVNTLLGMKPYLPHIKTCVAAQFIPEKLGGVCDSLHKENIDRVYTKHTYTMLNDELVYHLEENAVTDIIVTGMETQWCINSTVMDLTSMNYTVYVPVDAIGNSVSNEQNQYNIESLRNNRAKLVTTDGLVCQNLRHADDIASKKYLEILKQRS